MTQEPIEVIYYYRLKDSAGVIVHHVDIDTNEKIAEDETKTGKVGEDPIKVIGLDDEVADFELTANRGDLLSILGMAYELGAIYDTGKLFLFKKKYADF